MAASSLPFSLWNSSTSKNRGRRLYGLEGCSLLRYYASFPSSPGQNSWSDAACWKFSRGCCRREKPRSSFSYCSGKTLDRMDREPVVGSFLWVFCAEGPVAAGQWNLGLRAVSTVNVRWQLRVCSGIPSPWPVRSAVGAYPGGRLRTGYITRPCALWATG